MVLAFWLFGFFGFGSARLFCAWLQREGQRERERESGKRIGRIGRVEFYCIRRRRRRPGAGGGRPDSAFPVFFQVAWRWVGCRYCLKAVLASMSVVKMQPVKTLPTKVSMRQRRVQVVQMSAVRPYTVRKGDMISTIAQKRNLSVEQIKVGG